MLAATLYNKGAVPYSVLGITLSGNNAKYFAQSNNCPANLAAGGSCTIRVTFALLAQSMRINDAEIEHIRRGAYLHDIGKMNTPEKILFKPAPLDEKEWEVVRHHPVDAYGILQPIEFLKPALDIPHYHHERWDGTGYPNGLKGEEIPIAARIFAVVDVYDVLLSDRPYRPAWKPKEAATYIQQNSGREFDPNVARLFLDIIQ